VKFPPFFFFYFLLKVLVNLERKEIVMQASGKSIIKLKGKLQIPPLNFHRFTENPPDTKKLSNTPPELPILSLRTLLVVYKYVYICPYTLHSKTTPFWACPKRCRFGQNGVVLGILGFFFFFFFLKEIKRRKLKNKNKKGGNRGGWNHPLPKSGVAGPPRFWPRGGFGHPIPAVWGWPKPPQAFGGGPATPKGPKKKKKKGKMGFGLWGWPDHPLGHGGGRSHHLWPAGGVRSHPQALGDGPATPKGQNPFFPFFFFFGPFGVAGPPPKAWGGFGHPHTAGIGWPKPPLGQKWGGPATPLLGRGWLQPPRFPLLFFFFFFFFKFPSFFQKKKKKKNLKCKTTQFCPKRRCFGRAQNGVVLEWRV
jgi:hypothetical protein